VFCNYSCSVATDTLGLNCSVNRQDMKLDRVSVFCYNKRCSLRVKMQSFRNSYSREIRMIFSYMYPSLSPRSLSGSDRKSETNSDTGGVVEEE